jgi:hypothetical protein
VGAPRLEPGEPVGHQPRHVQIDDGLQDLAAAGRTHLARGPHGELDRVLLEARHDGAERVEHVPVAELRPPLREQRPGQVLRGLREELAALPFAAEALRGVLLRALLPVGVLRPVRIGRRPRLALPGRPVDPRDQRRFQIGEHGRRGTLDAAAGPRRRDEQRRQQVDRSLGASGGFLRERGDQARVLLGQVGQHALDQLSMGPDMADEQRAGERRPLAAVVRRLGQQTQRTHRKAGHRLEHRARDVLLVEPTRERLERLVARQLGERGEGGATRVRADVEVGGRDPGEHGHARDSEPLREGRDLREPGEVVDQQVGGADRGHLLRGAQDAGQEQLLELVVRGSRGRRRRPRPPTPSRSARDTTR